MQELSLEELKGIELNILKVFRSFCEEHNIRYFLAYGTLLGAIKYKKFIPWDDDVDVLVPREDYDRLLTLFQDSEKYRLYAFERNTLYRYPFAKLCDMTTRLVEIFYPNNGVELGVNIDIFPLDHWDDDFEKAKKELRRIKKLIARLSWLKVDKPLTENPVKFALWKIIIACCRMHGSGHYIRKIIKESNKKSQDNSRYMGAKSWPMWGDGAIMPAELFSETIEIEFEGERFKAPVGYDAYLRSLYGDYTADPPAEKQKTHHAFDVYRL